MACMTSLEKGFLNPRWKRVRNGGDDETRTRDVCLDSALSIGKYLKLRDTDGSQSRGSEP